LRGNELGEEGARPLADALHVNSSLTHLNIADNQIGNVGMRVIGLALLGNTASKMGSLKCDAFDLKAGAIVLDLPNKGINRYTIALLAAVIKANGSVTSVSSVPELPLRLLPPTLGLIRLVMFLFAA
jgi:hypothetical protein